eukprot:CAMPEP_0172923344 /NCGR_PEP_ID=MMETSP1075-20121228/209554_1 /TAXON_ID=2916 /ORGANISM="Ceratium fusus, Strain PA161109" /LENGTH=88 /DNA_ID=CAMNT_0013783799 /DNA_START=91 /DNA_END=354 /DNA_ORIENTATION=-
MSSTVGSRHERPQATAVTIPSPMYSMLAGSCPVPPAVTTATRSLFQSARTSTLIVGNGSKSVTGTGDVNKKPSMESFVTSSGALTNLL